MVAAEVGRQPSTVTHRPSLAVRVGGTEGVCLWRNYSVAKYQASRSSDTAPIRKRKGHPTTGHEGP